VITVAVRWCLGYGLSYRDVEELHGDSWVFIRALNRGASPVEVSTDRAPAYPRVLDELLPAACYITQQYANNAVEADHGGLKSRLRPMRGLTRLRSARVISAGHMHSFKTYAEVTTNWQPISTHATGSQQLSPNSPSPAEQPSIAITAACLTSR
jgi:transposase-like protein